MERQGLVIHTQYVEFQPLLVVKMLSVDLLRRKRLFNSWIYLTFNISIPVESGSRSFVELIGDSLEKIQYRFNKVLVVIIDEYSMVSLDLLGKLRADCVKLREDETCLLVVLI